MKSNFLVWKKPNKLEFYEQCKEKRKYQLPKNERIKDIASSRKTYLILTESGKVWSLANSNGYKEVPLLDADLSTYDKLRPVTFFEEKKLFVNSLTMGIYSGHYLCNGDQLYASGSNYRGALGTGKESTFEHMPVYVHDKVTKIFAGSAGTNSFFITSKPDLLYACGNNGYGELGIGSTRSQNTPAVVKNFLGSEILTVKSGNSHTILINKKGQTFSCGHTRKNGLGVEKTIFTLIPELKKKKAVQLATGLRRTLVLTDQNELYGWGFDKSLFPTDESNNNNRFPIKITLPEQTLSFLKWVYYDEISEKDKEKLEQTFNSLKLTFPPSVNNTLEKDIARLYQDDDSKDFKILMKIEEENENENEDEEVNYEEIPVHKFILFARSGLFRAMFDYVNEKDSTNKVQDYTNKSFESLKILIKYFYTNSIEQTTNEDPKLIFDELSDAVEYYQLNDQCNFVSELLKIKKQYDLN
ncbi:btk-binding protein-related [Anaeramoeba flamelloides]|uniref:Btk-binding protein-related n=1 Tax=Anaeramoeba flamelloides TaxID=1746091 RepID=A0AAV7ZD06_9EUKA|nr:btk-binding protein-related [Anaeramoeba flamelloides]